MTICAPARNTVSQQRYVERSTSLDDRRYTLVRVTPTGRRLVSGLVALAQKHECEILSPFEAKKIEALKEILRELIDRHSSRS